jgi:hypothetical protein
MFSSSTTPPSVSAPAAAVASSPWFARVTSVPSNSPNRPATGASEYFALSAPGLGAAEVSRDHHPGTGVEQSADRGHRGPDPAVVGDGRTALIRR